MKYIFVKWIHSFPNEPIFIYAELDDMHYETRKVEIFPNKSIGYATKDITYGSTQLGIIPTPSIDEIGKDPQFEPHEITKEEFEEIWSKRQNI